MTPKKKTPTDPGSSSTNPEEQLNLTETQPTHESGLESGFQQDLSEQDDEDTVMKEASKIIKEQLAPLMVNKKKDPAFVLKIVLARRDTYFSLYTDMVNTEAFDDKSIKQHLNEIRAKVEDLNQNIAILKNSVRLSNEKVTASVRSSLIASNGGIRLSKQHLPKFQLQSSSNKYFPKDKVYESVDHFLRSFEKVISSIGENVEAIWRRYIPLTLPYELDNWLNHDVMACRSWAEVGAALTRSSVTMLCSSSNLEERFSMPRCCVQESPLKITLLVSKTVSEANYSLDNTTISDAFLTGFPEEWQTQINTVLLCNHTDRDFWTIDEIHMAAINIYNSKLAPISFVNKGCGATTHFDLVEQQTSKTFPACQQGSSGLFLSQSWWYCCQAY